MSYILCAVLKRQFRSGKNTKSAVVQYKWATPPHGPEIPKPLGTQPNWM